MGTIKVTVVSRNGVDYTSCPKTIHLPCPAVGTLIAGYDSYLHSDNLQQTWKYPAYKNPAVLPAVSFPVVAVTSGGVEYLVIADDESPAEGVNNVIAELCNECCIASPGGEPEATATIATIIPVLQHMAVGKITQNCVDGVCTYDYFDTLPLDNVESPTNYSLQFSCGGVLYTSGATHFTDDTTALNWASTNWAALGTWTLVGNQLRVSGTSCKVGSLSHTIF